MFWKIHEVLPQLWIFEIFIEICSNISFPQAAAKSETSSLHSQISVESFIELDEKALTKINYIVNELIATEKTYMQDLQDIVMVRESIN